MTRGTSRSGRAARAGFVGFAGFLLIGLAACSEPTAPRFELKVAAARWAERGPQLYTFVFRQSCECLATGTYLVRVENGVVVEARPLPLESPPEPPPDLAAIPTIDDLFDRLRAAAAAGPIAFEVEYDDPLGYPRMGSFDISAEGADDEYSFEVREVQDATPQPLTE
jgi:hypothetical protein